MKLLPEFALTTSNAFWLMVPLFVIRFLIPMAINKASLPKFEYFPETLGFERVALNIYFVTNTLIIFSPLAMKLKFTGSLIPVGIVVYVAGCVFLLMSVSKFSADDQFTSTGIYRISRNPMYLGYYLMFLGTGLLIHSVLYILLVHLYQFAVHFLILSEERWCINRFGTAYSEYLRQVPRYLLK